MPQEKTLAKITKAELGHDGDGRFGLNLVFTGSGIGCGTFEGTWAQRSEHAQWSLADQAKAFADVMYLLRDTLTKAKRRHADQLVGVPVELTFEGNMLRSWRVLEEVI